jgi:DNA polymerase III delta' subunit
MSVGLGDILGQARVVDVLRAALAAGKVHHAYLFEGPVGSGKATTARALAMALNCERGRDGCGACDPCLKIIGGTHPDFLSFDMTPKGLTERVRDLVGVLGFRPHEGRARVVVLDPAEALVGASEQAQAANVLLKTLEEPPAATHFVLVTAEPKRLPITVRSRCQRLRFRPLADEDAARLHAEDEEAQAARAARRDAAARLLEVAKKPRAQTLFDASAELGGDRDEADAICAVLWTALRDALLVREGLAVGRVSEARVAWAREKVGDRASSSLLSALAATSEARQSLRGNVAPSLVLEHLILQLARPA